MAASWGFADSFMGCGSDQAQFMGHGIGLEMDEFPALAQKFEIPLEENTVIALEPKIALPPYGMVGVEHTFVVTPAGGHPINEGRNDELFMEVESLNMGWF